MAVSIDAQAAINQIAAELAVRDKETEIEETAKLESKAFWDGVKGQASAAGVSIMEWLGEVAFQGSQNPTGMVQETLGALSYPFRETAEVGFDYINPWSRKDEQGNPTGYMHSDQMPDILSFLNENEFLRAELGKNPVIAAAPALLGGFGIPVNKWAEGEDVLKGDVVAGVASLTGPVAGLTARGVGKVAQKVAPTLTDEVVDQTRRGLLKATGVGTGLLAAPVIAGKALMKMGTKTAAGNVAVAAGGMAENFMLGVGKLLDNASKKIVDTSEVIGPEGITHGANRSPSSIIKMTRSQEWTRNFFERFREIIEDSLGPSKIGHPINAVQRVNDETTIGLLDQLTDEQFEYLMQLTGRTSKEGPKRINSVLTDGSNEVMDVIKAEKKALSSAQREFDDYWHKDWEFEGGWVDTPQLTRYERAEGNIKLLRQYEKELEILEQNDEMVKIMFQSAQDVKWGLMHIEHLAKTDPDTLIRILNQIAEEAKLAPTGMNFEELMQFRGFGGSGKPFGSKQTILEDRSETIRSWRVHGSEGVGDIAKKLLKELGEEPDPTRILSGTVGRTFDEPLIDIGKRERNWANMRGSSRKLSGRYYDESGRLDEYSTGRYASDIPHPQSSPPSRWVDKARNK